MALSKEIELDNGVIVRYHRIVSINKVTNVQNTIEVASYTSKEKREEEQEAIEKGLPMNVFIDTTYEVTEYNQDIDIKEAYEYLKTTEKFKNAEDC